MNCDQLIKISKLSLMQVPYKDLGPKLDSSIYSSEESLPKFQGQNFGANNFEIKTLEPKLLGSKKYLDKDKYKDKEKIEETPKINTLINNEIRQCFTNTFQWVMKMCTGDDMSC